VTNARTVRARHNSLGLRDDEFILDDEQDPGGGGFRLRHGSGYLLLQKLWPKMQPAIVVLIFCTHNDRADNRQEEAADRRGQDPLGCLSRVGRI
jgi:hypothetical protein